MSVEYRSVGQYPTHGVTMAGALKTLGVSLDKIDYMKLVGDESSGTTDCLGSLRSMSGFGIDTLRL